MKTDVSIIIPIFNAMPYLEECLESISCQVGVDMEVLLINNGSTDESLSVCNSFADRFSFMHVYNIKSTSIGSARNYGLKHAKGEYVMFVDADDFLPDVLTVAGLLKKTRSKNCDICVGNFSRLWGSRLLHATSHRTFSHYPMDSVEFIFTGFFSVDILSYVWAKMYKKSFIDENGLNFSDSRYAEDKLFNLQCCVAGAEYAFLNREVYVHRNTPESVSNRYRAHSHTIWLEIARKLDDFIKLRDKDTVIWKNVVAYTIFFGCFFDCKMEYRHNDNEVTRLVHLIKEYRRDPLAKRCFKLLSKHSNIELIPSMFYRIMITGFAFCMRFRLYRALALGMKVLVDLKIDESLSDTGKKPQKE